MFQVSLWWFCFVLCGWAEAPTATEIMAKIDANMTAESRHSKVTMTVTTPRGRVRSFEMETWGRGERDSAVVYLSPSRDKGTKMLKLGEELWIYLPGLERSQKISGHMLRQGMMGSDFSYEDMMDSRQLLTQYKAKNTGSAMVNGRDCWVLEMVATEAGVSYPKRVAWIDKETFVTAKQELYALSGMKLKTWLMSEVVLVDGSRYFPHKMVVEDHLRRGSKTELLIHELTFGVLLEDEIFSKRWLSRQ
jgi:outer membrane lipoprotein-sorting protein